MVKVRQSRCLMNCPERNCCPNRLVLSCARVVHSFLSEFALDVVLSSSTLCTRDALEGTWTVWWRSSNRPGGWSPVDWPMAELANLSVKSACGARLFLEKPIEWKSCGIQWLDGIFNSEIFQSAFRFSNCSHLIRCSLKPEVLNCRFDSKPKQRNEIVKNWSMWLRCSWTI